MHVLYVARDRKTPTRHDLGSVLCLRVLDLLPPHLVDVQECTARSKPVGVVGTPTLLTPHGESFRGHQALSKLQHLAVELAVQRGETKEAPTRRRPSALAPNVQLRTEPREPPPPEQEDRGDPGEEQPTAEVASLWETRIDDADQEEEESDMSSRKITSDDLARAMRAREGRTE